MSDDANMKYFWLFYSLVGSPSSFLDVDDGIAEADGLNNRLMSKVINKTMPHRYYDDKDTLVQLMRDYANNYPNLGYSVENRDEYGQYADRESYLCAVLASFGLFSYVNVDTEWDTQDYTSMTLAQILSYAINNSLLIAINGTSIEALSDYMHSGDIILCRTSASKTVDALYGIGDIYMWDEETQCGLKWTNRGLEENDKILNPTVVFRPLLEWYGLPAIGPEDFYSYINTVRTVNTNINGITTTSLDMSGMPEIDRTTGASGSGGSIPIETAKKYIWYNLVQELDNEFGAAALMGNLAHESGFASNNLQNNYETSLHTTDAKYTADVDNGTYNNFVNDSAGYGLAQWTYYTRKQALLNYAKSSGCSVGSLAMQVNFLIQELKTSYGSVWEQLKTATNVKVASDYVLTQFERPADQSENAKKRRANSGETIYNQFKGSTYTERIVYDEQNEGTGAGTEIAQNNEQYEESGLLYGPNNQHLDLSTSMLDFSYGTQQVRQSSPYGWRGKPSTASAVADGTAGKNSWHSGIDLLCMPYSPAYNDAWWRYTYADCTIVAVQTNASASTGCSVTYRPDGANFTIQEMHYKEGSIPSNIVVGAHVPKGTKIGMMGTTGNSTGYHVHFQINTFSPLPDSSGTNRSTANPTALLKAHLTFV